jgi:ketosteroid isomerase-like protein
MNRRGIIVGLLVAFCAVAVFPLTIGGTRSANASDNANASKDEQSLRAADIAWSDAAGRKDLDAVVGYMTEDGETLAPNEPAAHGADAIRASWKGLLALPDLVIKWEPKRVQVASSGDIGYTSGTWTLTFTGPNGKPVSDHGKYLEVWKKIDGKWKCTLDMYNSDVPAK